MKLGCTCSGTPSCSSISLNQGNADLRSCMQVAGCFSGTFCLVGAAEGSLGCGFCYGIWAKWIRKMPFRAERRHRGHGLWWIMMDYDEFWWAMIFHRCVTRGIGSTCRQHEDLGHVPWGSCGSAAKHPAAGREWFSRVKSGGFCWRFLQNLVVLGVGSFGSLPRLALGPRCLVSLCFPRTLHWAWVNWSRSYPNWLRRRSTVQGRDPCNVYPKAWRMLYVELFTPGYRLLDMI